MASCYTGSVRNVFYILMFCGSLALAKGYQTQGATSSNGYKRLTPPSESWKQTRCYIKIPNSVGTQHAHCRAIAGEFSCREKPGCTWQGRMRQCAGKQYSRCPASVRSLCEEVKLVSELPEDTGVSREFICDPNAVGNPLQPIK